MDITDAISFASDHMGKYTIVPVANNYFMTPSDLVARAHAHNLQV
jgi:hypothetical protein